MTTSAPDTVTTVCCGTDYDEDDERITMRGYDWFCLDGFCRDSSKEAA